MATIREMYSATNAAWPEVVPVPTDWEVVRAASRLYRWARGEACPYEIRATSGNRYTWVRGRVLYVNPNRPAHGGGWKSFIHDLSHALDLERKAHSKHHARLERRMVEEVVKRGWLDGRLREEEAPEPTVDAKRAAELARIEAAIARWDSKKRRAETALKKLAKRQRYYSRALEAAAA